MRFRRGLRLAKAKELLLKRPDHPGPPARRSFAGQLDPITFLVPPGTRWWHPSPSRIVAYGHARLRRRCASLTASAATGDPSMNGEGTGPAVILDHHLPEFFVDTSTINMPS